MSNVNRIPLPSAEYLQVLGAVLYTCAYLEGMVVGDLIQLAPDLGRDLRVKVSTKTKAEIAKVLKSNLEVFEGGAREYMAHSAILLETTAIMRNDIAHSHPATSADGKLQLYRWRMDETSTGTRVKFYDLEGLKLIQEIVAGYITDLSVLREEAIGRGI